MDEMGCPVCTSAKGLKDRRELVEHMKTHKNNPDLMIANYSAPTLLYWNVVSTTLAL
jgi:hypothetical protein